MDQDVTAELFLDKDALDLIIGRTKQVINYLRRNMLVFLKKLKVALPADPLILILNLLRRRVPNMLFPSV